MHVPGVRSLELALRAREVVLPGTLVLPGDASGVVLFAHGSGSSRHSPRNRFVAEVLHQAGVGTLLFDLLTPEEAENRSRVFDIDLLADRLLLAARQVLSHPSASALPLGLFGASTGAAAALVAAAQEPLVRAVVSRGGRPDLAGPWLAQVRAPTLLIVGSLDHRVLELNRQALAGMTCEKHMAVVPGASHLFEEPGTLEQAAGLARDWFVRHLSARDRG